MDDFNLSVIEEILVVSVNLDRATYRDAQSFWEFMEIHQLFDQDKIIVDLTFCGDVDSAFIGMIVRIFRKVDEKLGRFELVFPQLNSVESFGVSGITKVLDCYETVKEALDAAKLGPSRKKLEMVSES